jgi:hypothetical protein
MNHPTVGFIVVGRVARIFLEGWTRAPKVPDRMVCGPARTLVDSGLPTAAVMDLVPVKPLAEVEPSVLESCRTRLPALFQKIKP